MAVDGLDLDFQHRFNLMRRDASPENEEENKAPSITITISVLFYARIASISSAIDLAT